jgi:PAS domain S-box-containing protein
LNEASRPTIRAKISILFAAVVGCIALFIYLYFPGRLEQQAVQAIGSKAETMAYLAGHAAIAGIHFEDSTAIADAIEPLRQNPEVRFVTVTDTRGRVLLAYDLAGRGRARSPAPGISEDRTTFRAIATIRYRGDPVGGIELGLSLDALYDEIARSRANVAAVSGLVLLFGFAGAFTLAGFITRPLARMVRVVERVSAGDLSERTAIRSRDEVGYLASAFDRMVGRLETAYGDLNAVNRELEARVQARTAELEREIDERRRAEVALRESEHQFRTMFESAAIGIALVDRAGHLLEVNRALLGMIGVERDALLAGTIHELVGTGDATTDWSAFQEVVDGSREEVAEDVRCRASDGRQLWGHAAVSAVRDRTGAFQFAIVMIENTTEQRELEQQLTQSQKLEAVGRLAGGIAHDFNNLLTTINGLADLVLADRPTDDPMFDDLVEIRKAGDRAAALTGQLLAFSRRQVARPEAVDLNVTIRELATMLGRLIGEDIDLSLDLDPELSALRADPSQLTQVIMNLAVNARDAMPEGGRLRIATAAIELGAAQAARLNTAGAGPHLRLDVEDNGHGMDEQTVKRVFEPFFTTKAIGRGTGLGLATVYGIVQQSGGGIAVESAPGRGTRFSVYLPIPTDAMEPRPAVHEDAAAGGHETILVVEDEVAVRSLVARVLRARGYEVIEASNGSDALQLASTAAERIDAVVTDVIMPEMSGPAMIRRLTELRPELRVVYMSGYTQNEVLHHGIAQDEVSFLQKPMSPAALAAKVREVLDASPTPALN